MCINTVEFFNALYYIFNINVILELSSYFDSVIR